MAAPILLRALPLAHRHIRLTNASVAFRSFCTSASADTESIGPHGDKLSSPLTQIFYSKPHKDPPHRDDPDFRKWKDKEAQILEDIQPILCLTKEILHSERYMDGERLTPDDDFDEKAVVDKLLAYHPHSEDKIGCGLDSIMVDRHPQFKHSRCLFVVRTDGGWIDFSYQKCLRAYIRVKYPFYADRFIRSHFKRGSG